MRIPLSGSERYTRCRRVQIDNYRPGHDEQKVITSSSPEGTREARFEIQYGTEYK